MTAKKTVSILVTALLATAGAVEAQDKPAKYGVFDRLSEVGPTAKRQGRYMLDEVVRFFLRVDEVMTSDATSKTHVENAYRRATNRSINNWNERKLKLLDAYISWARQQGRKEKKLPADWTTYFNRIAAFLGDMADGRGYEAAVWKRELNTANKRFVKFAKFAPKAMAQYLKDVAEADKEMVAADETLELEVARLDDLKRHARHLRKIRNLIKNLSRYMVQQQKRGQEVMEDKALEPDTFQKGLDAILKWQTECDAEAELPAGCKAVPINWARYGKEAMEKYRKNYAKVGEAVEEFLEGSIFEDSDSFSDLEYGDLVDPVDELLDQVRARIEKIQNG